MRQSPLGAAPRGRAPESPFSKREGASVPAHTFRRGPLGSRAGTGLFWLPLGAPPGSSRFGRPGGAEIPRPAQAGGVCGRPEARLRCLPDPGAEDPQQSRTDRNIPLPTHQFQAWRCSLSSHSTLWWVRKLGGCPCGRLPQELRAQRTKVELEVGQDPFSFRASPPAPLLPDPGLTARLEGWVV